MPWSRPLAVVVALLFLASSGLAAETSAEASEARLARATKLLSSDEFEGRGVGTEGINKAADYIAAEFTRLGLKTDLFEGGPFQKFQMTVKTELGPKERNVLTLVGPPAEGSSEPIRLVLELGKSFTPLAAGGSGVVESPLMFAGYGITDKDNNYDDYAGLDVKDKVVLLIRKEPQQGDPKSVFGGTQNTRHATFMQKLANASEHGARGVILVNDDFDARSKDTSDRKAWREELDKLADVRSKLSAEGVTPEDAAKLSAEINKLAESVSTRGKRMAAGYDDLLSFVGAGEESGHKKLPVWFCLRSAIDPVVKHALGKDLATIEREIDEDLKPRSAPLASWKVEGEALVEEHQAEVKNVIAVLEGEGPLANETIVVGAHYDHVGFGGPGSLAPWTTEVHNGADDNASGTAALIEVAQRLVASGQKPQRRIVFMAFTAEERGLIGSAYYCRNPRFALENTVAMINMDMVGRLRDDKLIVFGTGTAAEFDPLVDQLAGQHGLSISKKEGGYGPSDHSSFYAQKVPVLHLFTDSHSDYHRPSDDFERINVAGMRRVADFVVDAVQRIDAAQSRPAYREIAKVEHIGGGGEERPYFGSVPDYASEGIEGLRITAVAEKGPAATGGMLGGDVIVGLGESKIGGIEDFDSALRKFKPGDRVKVKVRRGEKTFDLEVVLGKRPG